MPCVVSRCGEPVAPGQACLDSAGLHDDSRAGGWFARMHADCYRLMAGFIGVVCGRSEPKPELLEDWSWLKSVECVIPWHDRLESAVEHAAANGHHPYWREWLLIYERTWEHERRRVIGECCVDRSCNPDTCMRLPDGLYCSDCACVNGCLALGDTDSLDCEVCGFFPREFRRRSYNVPF